MTRPVALVFTSFDVDHDFLTTVDELVAGLQTEFTRADVDRNNSVSGFEYVDWSALVLGDRAALPDFRSLDPDFSNAIGAAEFIAAFRREFDRMDVNRDGFLTRSEMLLDAPQRRMGPAGQGGAPGGGGRRGPGGGGGGGGRRGPGGGQ